MPRDRALKSDDASLDIARRLAPIGAVPKSSTVCTELGKAERLTLSIEASSAYVTVSIGRVSVAAKDANWSTSASCNADCSCQCAKSPWPLLPLVLWEAVGGDSERGSKDPERRQAGASGGAGAWRCASKVVPGIGADR
eukprot:scaffold177559_cov31-Tisochrysis_lutea.AAC.2